MSPNPFEGFKFPEPVELPPLEPYRGADGDYGGELEVYGGYPLPEVTINDWVGGGAGGERRAFQPYGVAEDSDNEWRCYITPGLVLDNHILNHEYANDDIGTSGGDAVMVRIPTIDGVEIIDPGCGSDGENWVRPRLLLPNPPEEVYIYCRFFTDPHGNIKPDPEDETRTVWIEAFDTPQASTNHIPPNPEGTERDGEYYWLLAELCMENESADAVEVIHRHESNILWPGEFELNNDSADGSRIYRAFSKSRGEWLLRRIKGCYGLTDSEDGKRVVLNFDAANVGGWEGTLPDNAESGYGGAHVYVESGEHSCEDQAEFRALTPTTQNDEPQIVPTQVGDNVEIRGNNKDGSLVHLNCDSVGTTLIEWRDGLVITPGTIFFKAGCDSGDSGGMNFSGTDDDFTGIHQNGGSNIILIAFENGIAKTVTNVNIRSIRVCTDSSGEQTYDFLTTN